MTCNGDSGRGGGYLLGVLACVRFTRGRGVHGFVDLDGERVDEFRELRVVTQFEFLRQVVVVGLLARELGLPVTWM